MDATAPQPLYPPTAEPALAPLSIAAFLRRCVSNPLTTLPRAVYDVPLHVEEPINGRIVAWIMAPELVEQLLVDDSDATLKTEVEHRVFDPILGRGVLTSDHADWRWQRRALAPLFRPAGIDAYVPAMATAAVAQIARWRALSPDDALPDIEQDMSATTFDVIVRTMLGGADPSECVAVMQAGKRYLDNTSWTVAYGLLRLPRWLPHPAVPANWLAKRRLRAAVAAIVARRRTATKRGAAAESGDLLGRLLEARHPDTGAPMDADLVADNLATLLEAGHETTAKALTWTLYLLARAPEWQDRVRAEATAVLPASGAPASSDIARLVVTERVIKEAMRLYPPAPIMARAPSRPINIGGTTIPTGAQVVVPIFAIHRHTMLWEDPGRFDPDRFLPEHEKSRPRTQFMPFGAGPRICIGQGFAMVEAKVLLASFIRKTRFDWDGNHLPEPISRVTLRPRGGMPLRVSPVVD